MIFPINYQSSHHMVDRFIMSHEILPGRSGFWGVGTVAMAPNAADELTTAPKEWPF